jgi:hypothetical protein
LSIGEETTDSRDSASTCTLDTVNHPAQADRLLLEARCGLRRSRDVGIELLCQPILTSGKLFGEGHPVRPRSWFSRAGRYQDRQQRLIWRIQIGQMSGTRPSGMHNARIGAQPGASISPREKASSAPTPQQTAPNLLLEIQPDAIFFLGLEADSRDMERRPKPSKMKQKDIRKLINTLGITSGREMR